MTVALVGSPSVTVSMITFRAPLSTMLALPGTLAIVNGNEKKREELGRVLNDIADAKAGIWSSLRFAVQRAAAEKLERDKEAAHRLALEASSRALLARWPVDRDGAALLLKDTMAVLRVLPLDMPIGREVVAHIARVFSVFLANDPEYADEEASAWARQYGGILTLAKGGEA